MRWQAFIIVVWLSAGVVSTVAVYPYRCNPAPWYWEVVPSAVNVVMWPVVVAARVAVWGYRPELVSVPLGCEPVKESP